MLCIAEFGRMTRFTADIDERVDTESMYIHDIVYHGYITWVRADRKCFWRKAKEKKKKICRYARCTQRTRVHIRAATQYSGFDAW